MADTKKRIIVAVAIAMSKQFLQNYYIVEDSDEDNMGEEELIKFVEVYQNTTSEREKPVRILDYVDAVIPNLTEIQFKSHFRLSLGAFNALESLVAPHMVNASGSGRPVGNIPKKLLSVLWLLATPDSYRSVGERFDYGKSSLSDNFIKIIRILNKLAKNVVKWPRREEIQQISNEFATYGLQNVIGAVDGTYIPIKAPQRDAEVYITRKCHYAMTLQSICDANLNFTDCFIAYPGSVSDNRIFRNSHIYEDVQSNTNEYFPNETYIIGDKAYPLLSWCIPPYIQRQRLTAQEINFNTVHARTRQVIERCFGLLFGRFRRLKYLDMNRTDLIPATVIACCVLHNICLVRGDLDVDFIREGEDFLRENAVNYEVAAQEEDIDQRNGDDKRLRIARSLMNLEH